MRIDILTTQHRDCSKIDAFWRSWNWQPVYWDNTDQPPGAGRNRILKDFYSSDRSWLAMVDDDVIFDTRRGRAEEFLTDPYHLLNQMGPEITSWSPMNNIHHRVDITLQNPEVQRNWVFYRASWIGCLVFHRRTGQEFYNHPTDILEDMDWCIEQLQARQRIAHCMNLVQKNLGSKSTIFKSQDQRREQYKQAKQRIAQSYPGITLANSGKLIKTKLINMCWPQSPQWASIPGIGPSFKLPI